MNKKLMAAIAASSIVLACVVLAYGTGGSAGGGPKTFRIAHQRNDVYFSMLPLIIRKLRLLEKHLPAGVAVEWFNIDVQTDMRDALVAGKVDVAVLPTSQLIIANASGLPLVPVSDFVALRTGLYSRRASIRSVDNLAPADKISAASFGNASHVSLQIYCHEKYGNAGKFDGNLKPMPYADMWASVESSEDLSAALIAFSDSLRADASDKLTLLADLSPYSTRNCLGSVALAMLPYYDSHPALIRAYRRASREAVDFVLNNRREAALLLTEYWRWPVEVVERELADLPPSHELSEGGYDRLAAFMRTMGTLKSEPRKFAEFGNYGDIPKLP